MSNDFLRITKAAISRNGQSFTYSRISAGTYDIATGGAVSSSVNYTITSYKKHIRASQFNFPNLVGRELAMFYIASDALPFVPKVKDKISDGTKTFVIDSVQEHVAAGQVVLYRVVAVI